MKPGQNNDRPLLVIHHGALGDLVILFPVLQALHRRFGALHLLARRQNGSLAVHFGLADRSFGLEAACWAGMYAQPLPADIAQRLQDYQTILALGGPASLAINLRQLPQTRFHLVSSRPAPDIRCHVADHVWDQLCAAGLMDKGKKPPVLEQTAMPVVPRGNRILIHPGSGSLRKNWPLTNFLACAETMRKKGFRPEFLLGPAEQHLSGSLKSLNVTAESPADVISLAHLLAQSLAYVGNDSGAAHMAGILGIPTVAVFGPSDPVRWHPHGPRAKVLRPRTRCAPCFEAKERNCDEPVCLTGSSPRQVIAMLMQALA